jgi:TetR/AcrR family transcriptional repressor of mexJK operon
MTENGKKSKDERRAAILEIARVAFLHDGYAATSMSQIAAKLGGSKATLYSYFPSKKDLFFAVVDAESAWVMEYLYKIDTHSDIREASAQFCRCYITMILSDEIIAFERIVTAEAARFPEIGQAAYEFGYKRGLDRMEELMRQGMEAKLLRPANPRLAAEYLLNLCAGHLHQMRLWNLIAAATPEQIETQIALVTAAFMALYGNDTLATDARRFTGL